MLKVRALIFFFIASVIFISDIFITPYKITYADKPLLALIGILFISYMDVKMSESDNARRVRNIFYVSVIVLFLAAVYLNFFIARPLYTFPFMVGCFLQTVIYLRSLKRAKRYSESDIKIYEAPIPSIGYKIMSVILFIRDLFLNHEKLLESCGIKDGDTVLDYGAGPGAFSFAASGIVGESGRVYALDNQHLSVEAIERKAKKLNVKNLKTIYTSQGETLLEDNSVDYVLLIGVLHLIRNKDSVLNEIKRVMKDDGKLIVVSVHIRRAELESILKPYFNEVLRIDQTLIFAKKVDGTSEVS